MKRAEHVIAHDATRGDMAYAMECLHCGEIQRFVMPMQVGVYMAAGKAFERLHRHCRKRDVSEQKEKSKHDA